MAALVALQGTAPQIDTMGSFAQGAQARQQFDDNQITIAQKGLRNIGSIALGAMGGKLDGQVDPKLFEQGLDLLEQQGVDVKSLRGKPQIAPIAARASLDTMQQLQNAQSQKDYELAMKKFQSELAKASQPTPTDDQKELTQINAERLKAGKPALLMEEFLASKKDGGANGGVDFGDVAGVRKEIQGLPSYKNWSQAAPIYQAMSETAGRNTRASDLNLVYGLGKIMDPGSVVREGEMFMVQGINTLPDKLVEGINSVLTGQSSLTEETRRQILQEAYGRMKGYEGALTNDMSTYKGIADRYKINPSDILPNFTPSSEWNPAPAPGAQPQPSPAPGEPPPDGVEDWTTVFGGMVGT